MGILRVLLRTFRVPNLSVEDLAMLKAPDFPFASIVVDSSAQSNSVQHARGNLHRC